MPAPEEILSALHWISNEFFQLAAVWHVMFYILLISLVFKTKPSTRMAASLLSLPLFSVSIMAWISGNPFNGIIFLLFAGTLLILGLRMSKSRAAVSTTIWAILGILIIFYGLVYPHFIETESILSYIIVSPAGLIPCPTISVVIGFTLLLNGFNSKPWSYTLALLGAFYGLVGFFRLNVHLDAGLLIAAIFLLIRTLTLTDNKNDQAGSTDV